MFMLNEFMIACKISKEVAIFVGASQDDNECLVSSVLEIFEECLENITKNSLTKKSVMERYMQVGLLIDEMVDEGIVINTDSDYLENKLLMREPRISFEPVPSGSGGGLFRNVRKLN